MNRIRAPGYQGVSHTRGGPIRPGNSIQDKTESAPDGDDAEPLARERGTISRELASLALAWVKQDGHLRVRQREQLRRALGAAARILSWEAINQDGLEVATRDIAKLARSGTRSIRRELNREAESKKTETVRLRAAAAKLREAAEKPGAVYPMEFTYSHTARSPSRGLVTKTEPLTLPGAEEAKTAADTVERRSAEWDKLRNEMLEELKLRDQRWVELSGSLSSFAQSSRGMIQEVLAVLA